MGNLIDISGEKFNKLTAIKPSKRYKSGNVIWLCRCECGKECEVSGYLLRSGRQKSCGCSASERMTKLNKKHEGYGTRLYEIWRQMHRRCYGESSKAYKDYGGRGITICKEWKDDFSAFRTWAEGNGYTEALTIDRIDVNGNYEPNNCRWANKKTQANNRRNNRRVEYGGQSHTISEWADLLGVEQKHLRYLLNKNGWDLNKAIKRGGDIK